MYQKSIIIHRFKIKLTINFCSVILISSQEKFILKIDKTFKDLSDAIKEDEKFRINIKSKKFKNVNCYIFDI